MGYPVAYRQSGTRPASGSGSQRAAPVHQFRNPANDNFPGANKKLRVPGRAAKAFARRLPYLGLAIGALTIGEILLHRGRLTSAAGWTQDKSCLTGSGLWSAAGVQNTCLIQQAPAPYFGAAKAAWSYAVHWGPLYEIGGQERADVAEHWINDNFGSPDASPLSRRDFVPSYGPRLNNNPRQWTGVDPMGQPQLQPMPFPSPVPYKQLPNRPETGLPESSDRGPSPELVISVPRTVFSPNAEPTAEVVRGTRPQRPGPDTKENKVKFNQMWIYRLFSWAVDVYTETQDFVRAIFHALPEGRQRGVMHYDTKTQLELLWKYNDEIDLQEAVVNVILNQIEDHIIGRINSTIAKHAIDAGLYLHLVGVRNAYRLSRKLQPQD